MKVTPEEAYDLILSGKAPQGLVVGGVLDLSYSQIKELPSNLTVGGSLYLAHSQIKELPSGLTVGGYLYLARTQIEELPSGLTVGGSLNLAYSQIKELPVGLTVGGCLDLICTEIKKLPAGLKVGKGLNLYGSMIKDFPQRGSQNGKSGIVLAEWYYALVAHDDGSVSAGCRNFDSIGDALVHWNRDDERAKVFTEALLKFKESELVAA